MEVKGESDNPEEAHVDIDTFLASFEALGNKSHCPLVDGCQRLQFHDVCHRISLGEKTFSLAVLHDREIEVSSCGSLGKNLLTSSLHNVENMVLESLSEKNKLKSLPK